MNIKRIIRWFIGSLIGLLGLALAVALLVYPPSYVYRVLVWQESDAFDWQKFPERPLQASPDPYTLKQDLDPGVASLFEELSGAGDWETFLEENNTQAFIVVHDDRTLYEAYFNNTRRESIVTSFSVAKSFTSALIGAAIDDGYIGSVTDPITRYLPELTERDPGFGNITIQNLLRMASGLEYREFRPFLFNSDDPLTTYYPDQRALALENTLIIDPPGAYFRYNKYHPQLLGMILERSTEMPVTDYMQKKIWDPLGMEYGGSWSLDSRASAFEKMETGVNARAIDFTKFGALFRDNGQWNGEQVISEAWVQESTRPADPPEPPGYYPTWFDTLPGRGYYQYMWWGLERETGGYDFAAEGDKGQYIYVSPQKGLVIVRNGIDYGIPHQAWIELFYDFAGKYE